MEYDTAFKLYGHTDITLGAYEICYSRKGLFSGEIEVLLTTPLESGIAPQNQGKHLSGGAITTNKNINYKAFKAFTYNDFIKASLDINVDTCEIKLLYEIDARDFNEDFEGEILLKTCSKDFIIPVKITVSEGYFHEECADIGIVIKDFYDFYKTYENSPNMASRLFKSSEFKQFLEDNYSEYVGLYEDISYNHEKDVALEVFMVAVGIKEPIRLYFENAAFKLGVVANKKSLGTLILKKEGFGFVEGAIYLAEKCPALKLSINEFSHKDFDTQNRLYINYEIDGNKINSDLLINELKCQYTGGAFSHDFIVKKTPLISISLDKRAYRPNEEGEIIINNFSDEEVQGVVYTTDNYVKIDAKPYFIKDKLKIGFKIKFSPFYFLPKNAIIRTEIFVKLGDKEIAEPIFIVNFNHD